MDVARAGLAADPRIEPPRALRPLLRFRHLSASALGAVRRAVEEDDAFRARVADAADEHPDRVGEAGRLFLRRPEGWTSALEALEAAKAAGEAAASDEAEERTARRRLRVVEEGAQRAGTMVQELRAELAGVRAELVEERRARAAAEDARAAAEGRLPGLERERDAAHRRASALAKDVERLARDRPGGGPVAPAADAGVPAPGPNVGVPAAVVDEARIALAEAAAAAAAVHQAIDAAARALDGGAPDATPGRAGARGPSADGGAQRSAAPRRLTGRLPAPLPPGIHDDEPAAADHLVRLGGVLLVVDGYNATLGRWPDLPIGEQRRRLVDALVGLSARCGTGVHVVFDGADDRAGRAGPVRRDVRVTFSPRAVEADDVILDVVERLPDSRTVVVASDDRRVQREAAARGANVISQVQLFSLL